MARSAPTRAARWLVTAASIALGASALIGLPAVAAANPGHGGTPGSTACRLGDDGQVRHVIYIQFDNTHLLRDRANVPSDLEQMPHLLSFMQDNGTLLGNDHTILISHTGGGILSSLTGVYPDRHGQTVSNSYVRTSSTGGFSFPSSFGYWTDPVSAANTPTVPNMVTPDGLTAPAPWVPFTRAGCDVGEVATANTVLENARAIFTSGPSAGLADPTGDITKVFGEGSPQWNEAKASQLASSGTAARALAQTDFVGFAVHCAKSSPTCATGQDDVLPDEPQGYTGFKGALRRPVDQPAPDRPAGRHRPHRAGRQPDRRSVRPGRLPGLRRHVGGRVAGLHRRAPGARRAGHLRLHQRRPRQPRQRRQHPRGLRARARRATSPSSRRTTTHSRRSSPA